MSKTRVRNCRKHDSFKIECKACQMACLRLRVKTTLVNLLGGKCQICGYKRFVQAMDFHHLNPNDKKFQIAARIGNLSYIKILDELSKCILLCANCHRELESNCVLLSEDAIKLRNLYILKIKEEKNRIILEGEQKFKNCPVCNEEFVDKWHKKFCSPSCNSMNQRRIAWPSEKQLKKDLSEMPMVKVGKKYGVSDNAVRKWAKKFHLMPSVV